MSLSNLFDRRSILQAVYRASPSPTGVQVLVTMCPKGSVMFTDALKTTNLEDRLAIKEIAELVEEVAAV